MRLSRRVLDAYNRAVKLHGDDAEAATRRALDAWLDENRGATIAQTREAARASMQAAGTVHGRAAGEEARALRSAVAEASGISRKTFYNVPMLQDYIQHLSGKPTRNEERTGKTGGRGSLVRKHGSAC